MAFVWSARVDGDIRPPCSIYWRRSSSLSRTKCSLPRKPRCTRLSESPGQPILRDQPGRPTHALRAPDGRRGRRGCRAAEALDFSPCSWVPYRPGLPPRCRSSSVFSRGCLPESRKQNARKQSDSREGRTRGRGSAAASSCRRTRCRATGSARPTTN